MSARDDYQYGERDVQHFTMCDEIDRLRRWKAEALEVDRHWDAVAARFDLTTPEHLGKFTADAVGIEIDRLRTQLKEINHE